MRKSREKHASEGCFTYTCYGQWTYGMIQDIFESSARSCCWEVRDLGGGGAARKRRSLKPTKRSPPLSAASPLDAFGFVTIQPLRGH